MAVTPNPSRAVASAHAGSHTGAQTGSSAGFVLVVLATLLAALGVMQLEVHGAPWPAPQQQTGNAHSVLDMRQARVLRQDASSDAVLTAPGMTDPRAALRRVGNEAGK